jgi:predicted transport protein
VILIQRLKEMTLHDVKLSVQDITVIRRKIKQLQDIGHVTNGELDQR